MTLVIVETTFDPPLTDERRQLDQERLYPCLELRNVEWVQSFESLDRRRKVCLFRAPDVDAMRESLRNAGMPYDRIWAASQREPDPSDPAGPARVAI
jgi:hypothetical protein